jgi:CHAT domain-containing protein
MRGLYAGMLTRSEPPERALRAARLALRGSRGQERVGELLSIGGTTSDMGGATVEASHPFFWGPFIFIGAPRS